MHVQDAVSCLREGFAEYEQAFADITRRAPTRFARRDWPGMLDDARERLALYERVLVHVMDRLREVMRHRVSDPATWSGVRDAFAVEMSGHPAIEVAETFYNSISRRVLGTVGVNPGVEFLDYEFERVTSLRGKPYRTYTAAAAPADVLRAILADHGFAAPYADLDGDAARVAGRVADQWRRGLAPVPFEEFEILRPVFYRRKGAYLVGRVRGGNRVMPLVLALTHGAHGIVVDAVLLREEDVSVLFGFTRSYFHVDVGRPSDVIEFLRSIMPIKPVWELYTALGYHKHGKTELYRHLRRHLSWTDECFEFTPGTPGMVMAVFAMPSLDVVFKVIRDTFPSPKQTTPGDVKRRYRMVFEHDRIGRLVDAQEFEHLAFPRERFSKKLLAELLASASHNVRVDGDHVVIRHLYTERRVRPLDLYVADADPERALRAILDYGHAIRELAATNVFPGDFLLKNFGVTRHGRVVFYDYDEISLLEDCVFRAMPESRFPDEELGEEPWYGVGQHDVFPEELSRFLPLDGAARDSFMDAHGDLFQPAFWQELQRRNAGGDIVDIFPYGEQHRLAAARAVAVPATPVSAPAG